MHRHEIHVNSAADTDVDGDVRMADTDADARTAQDVPAAAGVAAEPAAGEDGDGDNAAAAPVDADSDDADVSGLALALVHVPDPAGAGGPHGIQHLRRRRSPPRPVTITVDGRFLTRSRRRPFRPREPSARQVSAVVDIFENGDVDDQIHALFNMLHYQPAMFSKVTRELRRRHLGTLALAAEARRQDLAAEARR